MIVLGRFLADRRRNLLWWVAGLGVTIALTVLLYPSIEGQASMDEMVEEMPDAFEDLFGLDGGVSMTSPAGYLQSQLFASTLPVVFALFAIGQGARAIGGAEEDGTLELLLANPVTRRRVLLERYLGVALLHGVLGAAVAAVTLATAAPVGALEDLSGTGLAASFFAVPLLGLLFATIAFAVGAATGHRRRALTVGAALTVGTYLIHGLAEAAQPLRPLRPLSPFNWLLERNMLVDGPSWQALVLPVVVIAVALVVGLRIFERRDLR